MMVREFFRSAGWDVSGGSTIREAEVQELIRNEWFDAAGLSMGSENQLEALKRFIRTIRATSKNPNIGIMVGGPIFSIHPEYVAMVGADATAADAPQAVIQAETLVALRR
jgi:methanogenic corrinoid protein MtbC1